MRTPVLLLDLGKVVTDYMNMQYHQYSIFQNIYKGKTQKENHPQKEKCLNQNQSKNHHQKLSDALVWIMLTRQQKHVHQQQ